MKTLAFPERKFVPFVTERFVLDETITEELKRLTPQFGYNGFGELVFYRTYSRLKKNGVKEDWADCVVRVTEGIFSIFKDYCKKNHLDFNEKSMQVLARHMSKSMFNMNWLPAGRGLFSMGTDYMYERGGICLFNCAFIKLDDFEKDCSIVMDLLMNGVGVGVDLTAKMPQVIECGENKEKINVVIDDSREGWCQSVYYLLKNIGFKDIIFDYSKIRPKGLPINGYGGISSGPEPLEWLHNKIREFHKKRFTDDSYSDTMYACDVVNCIGCCVVAGNVRRSAIMSLGSVYDEDFLNLKNYKDPKFKYRESHGWMSNNSVVLEHDSEFDRLGVIAEGIKNNGEPGFINLRNARKGRIGKNDGIFEKELCGVNPCSEIFLSDGGVCNLSEVFPTRCKDQNDVYDACKYASFYATVVNLLDVHIPKLNSEIKNTRRIGVSLAGVAEWKRKEGVHKVIRKLRSMYTNIREHNKVLSKSLGIKEAVKITTVKPGGSVPKLAGVSSGISHPTANYMIRRIRIQENSQLSKILMDANVPCEKDKYSMNTLVFEFPTCDLGSKPLKETSIWEQASDVALMQREWADNGVSCTITFTDEEEKDVEAVISNFAPVVKALSMLRCSKDTYEQMPEEEITKEEYEKRLSSIKKIDWKSFREEALDEKYCTGDKCEIKNK